MTTPSTSGIATSSLTRRAELQPHLVVHVLGADVRNLLAPHVGELLGLRDGGEQLIDADLTGGIAGLHVTGGGAGNRAARGEHDDGGKGLRRLRHGRDTRGAGNHKRHGQRNNEQRRSFQQHDAFSYG